MPVFSRHVLPRHLQILVEQVADTISCWRSSWGPDGISYSYSGGVDSEVFTDIGDRAFGLTIPRLFVNTMIEYPEVVKNARRHKTLVEIRPSMSYRQVLATHGFTVPSKRKAKMIRMLQNPTSKNQKSRNLYLTGVTSTGQVSTRYHLPKKWRPMVDSGFPISEMCCEILKEGPLRRAQKAAGWKPMIGIMKSEGGQRADSLKKNHECNLYDRRDPQSRPLKDWTKQDVLLYAKLTRLPIASVYGDIVERKGVLCTTGVRRTGCMFCLCGIADEPYPNRFQRMQVTHPLHHKCLYKLGTAKVLDFMGIPYSGMQLPLKFESMKEAI